jgi:hypothetical protein
LGLTAIDSFLGKSGKKVSSLQETYIPISHCKPKNSL